MKLFFCSNFFFIYFLLAIFCTIFYLIYLVFILELELKRSIYSRWHTILYCMDWLLRTVIGDIWNFGSIGWCCQFWNLSLLDVTNKRCNFYQGFPMWGSYHTINHFSNKEIEGIRRHMPIFLLRFYGLKYLEQLYASSSSRWFKTNQWWISEFAH